MVAPISRPDTQERQAELFAAEPVAAARMMIGWTLTVDGVGGRVVETEAYHHLEPASHAFPGLTPRNAVMFGPPGRVYVYLSYGIHWCLNLVVSGTPGNAVLIRALEPTLGLERMRERRGMQDARLLCSGPGKLGQALAVTHAHNGLAANQPPFALVPGSAAEIVVGPRIGITKAADLPWRFGEKGSRYLSRPFPKT
jgi:DNA-3-methyladenine glycosylase